VVIFGFEIGDFFLSNLKYQEKTLLAYLKKKKERENTTFKAYITNFLSTKLGLEPNMIVEGFNSNLATYN
jgi:hypothetical protein